MCKNLEIISLSEYAFNRYGKNIVDISKDRGIEIIVRKSLGRPSKLEKMINRKYLELKCEDIVS